jgi:hypothetical protein
MQRVKPRWASATRRHRRGEHRLLQIDCSVIPLGQVAGEQVDARVEPRLRGVEMEVFEAQMVVLDLVHEAENPFLDVIQAHLEPGNHPEVSAMVQLHGHAVERAVRQALPGLGGRTAYGFVDALAIIASRTRSETPARERIGSDVEGGRHGLDLEQDDALVDPGLHHGQDAVVRQPVRLGHGGRRDARCRRRWGLRLSRRCGRHADGRGSAAGPRCGEPEGEGDKPPDLVLTDSWQRPVQGASSYSSFRRGSLKGCVNE